MTIERVLIVEDNQNTLEWLKECVTKAFNSKHIILSETVSQAIELCDDLLDLALVDLHLPDGSGVEVLQKLHHLNPQMMTVVATIFDDDEHLFPALKAGAKGYLLKDQTPQDFIRALSGITEGKPPLSPAIARKILNHFNQPEVEDSIKITPREKEVLQKLGRGLQAKKIAQEMDISPYTVSDYIKSLYQKLSISSRAEAAVEAVKRGLV